MDNGSCPGEIAVISSKKSIRERFFLVLSTLLSLAALAFVIEKIWRLRFQLLGKIGMGQISFIILAGGVLYAIDNFLLVFAWKHMVDWFGKTKITWQTAVKIYGRTQIAKYIPGNILQFPSRHILGRQFGVEHKPLLGAGIFEITGLMFAASTISSLGILTSKDQIEALSLKWLAAIFLIGVLSPLLIHLAFLYLPILKKMNLLQNKISETYKGLLPTWGFYMAFLLFAGGILFGITYGISGLWVNTLIPIALSAYSISWLVGTLTPGAPGGAGVRETILILLLSKYFGESTSVLIAMASRLITILGDVYFYLFSRLTR